MDFEQELEIVLHQMKELLKAKNASYGNAALEPIRIFSKVNALEQLKVRIDDKLSRISKGSEFIGDDTIKDLIGYLVLYKIKTNETENKTGLSEHA